MFFVLPTVAVVLVVTEKQTFQKTCHLPLLGALEVVTFRAVAVSGELVGPVATLVATVAEPPFGKALAAILAGAGRVFTAVLVQAVGG